MRNRILEQKLCDAIKNHCVVHLKYKNQISSRTLEPYIVYRSTKDKILVSGYQTEDDSKPFKKPEFHHFEVELLSFFTVTDETFKVDAGIDLTDKMYGNDIICKIERF